MPNFNHLDELLSGFVKRGLPGCAAAVSRGDDILYEGYHGMADIESKRPIAKDTVYRLYSMTKVIICTAGLMLYERGKFLLNDPLSEYLPEYRNHKIVRLSPDGSIAYEDAMTQMLVKHAFTMGVGLPYPGYDNPAAPGVKKIQEECAAKYGDYTLQQYIRACGSAPINSEPGERFTYGLGHDIVAALIEVISGMSVGEFLKKEIFEPLEMNSTGYRYFGDIKDRMASAYRMEDMKPVKYIPEGDRHHEPDAKLEGGGSGLFSTLGDYLRFAMMMANGGSGNNRRIIGRKTIDMMRINQLPEEPLRLFGNFYNKGYGYGLGVRTMLDLGAAGANNSSGSFGWSGALGTWVEIDPAEKLAIVYMHQTAPSMEAYHHLRVRAAVNAAI